MSMAPFIAYELAPPRGMKLRPAASGRAWMDESANRYAYRCLPLSIANQHGWVIESPRSFTVRWDGSIEPDSLDIEFDDATDPRVASHFGHGVLTFSIPYLFRTPHGVNLWVKGPSNQIKDGAQALDAVVETDWSVAPFTMNWRITRVGHPVRFERGEPICMLVPIPRGLAESLEPRLVPIERDRGVWEDYRAWKTQRSGFNRALLDDEEEATKRGWEKDYHRGRTPRGAVFDEHQTRLHLREFLPDEGPEE